MADKKELTEFCDTVTGLAEKINELIETDIVDEMSATNPKDWFKLLDKAKSALLELAELIEDEIEKV